MLKDSLLPAIREVMAGVLAIIIMALFLMLIWRATGSLPTSATAADFAGVKELLAIVNPTVGLIIGYYFARVTTEARAEKAEETAQTASRSAEEAVKKEAEAKKTADEKAKEADESKDALNGLTAALENAQGINATAGTTVTTQQVEVAAALLHAKRILRRA